MTGCEPTEVLKGQFCGCCCHKPWFGDPSQCFCNCGKTVEKFTVPTSELQKRIEALEKYREDNSKWTSSRAITENAVYLKVSQLEQERDKGVERIKSLEETIKYHQQRFDLLGNVLYENIDETNERLKNIEETVRQHSQFWCVQWKCNDGHNERLNKLEVLHGNLSKNDVQQYGFIDVLKTRLKQVENSIAILEQKIDQQKWNELKQAVVSEVEQLQKEDQIDSDLSNKNIAYDLAEGFPLSSDVAMKILNGNLKNDTNLSQQNPVVNIAQEPLHSGLVKQINDELKRKFTEDFEQDLRTLYGKLLDFVGEFSGKVHKGACLDLGLRAKNLLKEIDSYGEQDHIVDADKKVVTIYEAIRAFREGKTIYRVCPPTNCPKINKNVINKILSFNLLHDDWVIEDE